MESIIKSSLTEYCKHDSYYRFAFLSNLPIIRKYLTSEFILILLKHAAMANSYNITSYLLNHYTFQTSDLKIIAGDVCKYSVDSFNLYLTQIIDLLDEDHICINCIKEPDLPTYQPFDTIIIDNLNNMDNIISNDEQLGLSDDDDERLGLLIEN